MQISLACELDHTTAEALQRSRSESKSDQHLKPSRHKKKPAECGSDWRELFCLKMEGFRSRGCKRSENRLACLLLQCRLPLFNPIDGHHDLKKPRKHREISIIEWCKRFTWTKPKSTTGKPSLRRWKRMTTPAAGFICELEPLPMGNLTRCRTSRS